MGTALPPPLGVGLAASATKHERALTSGLATIVGSSLMTLVAYDLGPGTDWARAWILTAVLAGGVTGTASIPSPTTGPTTCSL